MLLASFLSSWLFESPWLLVAAFALAGLLLFFAVRERPAVWLLGPVACGLLAAGSFALANSVVTDREAAEEAVRSMVAAAAPFDAAAFDAALRADAQLLGPTGEPWLRLSDLRSRIERFAGASGSVEHVIKTLEVDPVSAGSDGRASTLALLRVTSRGGPGPGGSGLPTTTDWELDLRRGPQGPWQIHSFRWLRLNLQPPPDINAWR